MVVVRNHWRTHARTEEPRNHGVAERCYSGVRFAGPSQSEGKEGGLRGRAKQERKGVTFLPRMDTERFSPFYFLSLPHSHTLDVQPGRHPPLICLHFLSGSGESFPQFYNKSRFGLKNVNSWHTKSTKKRRLNSRADKRPADTAVDAYSSRRRRTAERTEAAAVVEYTQAPPATTRLHRLQDQIPTQERFMASLPQNVQVYLACWVISIFFTILRREAP